MNSRAAGLVSVIQSIVISVIIWPNVHAACDNLTEPSDSSKGLKVLFGHAPDLPDLGVDRAFYKAMAFSPPYPSEQVRKGDFAAFSSADTSTISYWEPGHDGRMRVCRAELWSSTKLPSDEKLRTDEQAITRAYTVNAPSINRLTKDRRIYSVTLVHYDALGRIKRISERDLTMPGFPIYDVGCRSYSEKHQLLMSIQPNISRKCPDATPDPRDFWYEYRYGGPDQYGVPERLMAKKHIGRSDGQWAEKWHPFAIGSSFKEPWGNADVSSDKGVTLIWGADIGHLDNNSGNTVLNSLGQSTGMNYAFTKPPVPIDVLQKADALYRYERRRYTLIADGVKMFELFPANSHLSRHRYYLLDGLVVRHEQLNADGSPRRVITLENYSQPYPGPKPLIDDKKLSKKGKLVHRVFHRVYDIDRKGNPTLVAMSWNRRKHFTQYADVPVEFADLAYGTPDGKERWKSRPEFERTFDTSSRAAHVFPDLSEQYPTDGP